MRFVDEWGAVAIARACFPGSLRLRIRGIGGYGAGVGVACTSSVEGGRAVPTPPRILVLRGWGGTATATDRY